MTADQYILARTHEPIADRLSGDIAGLFPDRRDALRRVAIWALIDAAIEWHPGSNQATFEELAGARVRDALAKYTVGWRVEG